MSMIPQPRPTIVSKSGWDDGRKTDCTGSLTPTKLVVHHCYSNNNTVAQRTARQHQLYLQKLHMDTNGWCDIGYHFGIGRDGTILEGRSLSRPGAHVSGHNSYTLGVVVHGNYHDNSHSTAWELTNTQFNSLVNLLAWLCTQYQITPSNIVGHRDLASSHCPGDKMYPRLRDIRDAVTRRVYGVEPE